MLLGESKGLYAAKHFTKLQQPLGHADCVMVVGSQSPCMLAGSNAEVQPMQSQDC